MSREINVCGVGIGGNNPVRVAGMLKTPSNRPKQLVREALSLEKEGAELIRLAFKQRQDVRLWKMLSQRVKTPLVADIHFSPELAFLAMDSGFKSIRLNPLNISRKADLVRIVDKARDSGVTIRAGVNSGGIKRPFKTSRALARTMVNAVLRYIKIFENRGFFDIMVSLKASDVFTTLLANRMFARACDYPLQLGVTAAGPFQEGVIKSSLGIGILLSEGIGDLIRVSLTGKSVDEIIVAREIIKFLGKRDFKQPEIISCPTCGRCEVNLIKKVEQLSKVISRLSPGKLPGKIALMGCVVNGPGEASQADIGLAFGKNRAVMFKKGKIIGNVEESKAIESLMKEIGYVV